MPGRNRSFPPTSTCKPVASTLTVEQFTPYRGAGGSLPTERGLTDSPCLHHNRDGVSAYADSVGWDFPVECRFLSFQPDAIYRGPPFEISFDFLFITKGSKTSVAAAIDSIMAVPFVPLKCTFWVFCAQDLKESRSFQMKMVTL